jgi:two-component system sensor histidine kinase MprB
MARRRVTLRVRLTVLVALVVALGVVVAIYASYRLTRQQLVSQVDAFVADRAHQVANAPSRLPNGPVPGDDGPGGGGDGGGLVELDAVTQTLHPDATVDQSFGAVTLPIDAATKQLAAQGGRDHYTTATVDGTPYRIITVARHGGGAVQVGRSLHETNSVLDALRNRLLLIGLAGVAVAAVLAWLVARRITRPLAGLTAAAGHVAATQQLDAEIPVEGDAELAELAESFNTMLGALAGSRRQQQQLVQDASHELRTPLTSIRANLELLGRSDGLDPGERTQVLHDALGEVDEMADLTQELVELATDEATDEPSGPVDLADLVSRNAQRMQRRTQRTIEVRLEDPAVVEGRPGALEHAVANLLVNAVKFGPPGTPIEVTVSGASVRVRDHGPGIAPDDLPHVFDRFYRSEAARALPGSGLGLAIVRQAVERSGGSVVALNAPDGGAVVGFDLTR